MKSAPAITLWAVIATHTRTESIISDTIRRTRRAAIEAYNGGRDGTDWYTEGKKLGWIRVERVRVSLKEPL